MTASRDSKPDAQLGHSHQCLAQLPGHELVLPGIDDITAGRRTAAALLVLMFQDRLREAGVPVHEGESGLVNLEL